MGKLLVIAIAIAAVVALFFAMRGRRPQPLAAKPTAIGAAGGASAPAEPPTGGLEAAGPDAWVLNPKSPLPLTVVGASRDTAERLRMLLHTPGAWTTKQPQVAYLIAVHNLRFKEIEAFLAQQRTRYLAEVGRQKEASPEWVSASELDREDLLAGFEERAVESLGLNHGSFDLALLLTGEAKHLAADDALLERFAGDASLYAFYLGQLGRGGSVATVPSDDFARQAWESLVAKGLARRGRDIPAKDLLEGLRLKDLNALIAGSKPVGRKAKAIEAALALPDLPARLEQAVSYRELFQALPPADLEVADLADAFAYADALARVALITCYTAVRTLESMESRQRGDGNAYEITNFDSDPPPPCARPYLRVYQRLPAKRPPFHVGCNCTLECTYTEGGDT
jgi:hypothetical protein